MSYLFFGGERQSPANPFYLLVLPILRKSISFFSFSGVTLLGGLGVFVYKRHKASHDANEPFSPYDDDQDMSQYGPVTQRPMGSVTQHEGSDNGSYGQYQQSAPPLGNVVQQTTQPPGSGYGQQQNPGFAQYQQPLSSPPPMGNAVQHAGIDNGSYGQYNQSAPPLGNVVQQTTQPLGSGYGQQNPGFAQYHQPLSPPPPMGNVVQHLPPGSGDMGYGQYQNLQGFLAPVGYRHSLSTTSQENDTQDDSHGDSRNWGYGHYRSPSDESYERGHVPDEVPAASKHTTTEFDKPDLRD